MQTALNKALDVGRRVCEGVVVACDTVVECQGFILGKPRDEQHAGEMLRQLSGRIHRVYSGLCVWNLPDGAPRVRFAESVLRMALLSEEAIEEYLKSALWNGKAGAFGYQDRPGFLTLESGSESNVVGLPMELLAEMLAG